MLAKPNDKPALVELTRKHPLRSSKGETRTQPKRAIARRARAANFIVDIANGMSTKAVAEKYGVTAWTVVKELRWAEREGFYEKAEDAIAHRLVPLAIDVYEKALKRHLDTGDYDAAEKLLKGVRLFSNGPTRSEQRAADGDDGDVDELTWEKFTMRRRARLDEVLNDAESAADASDAESGGAAGTSEALPSVVEAEVLASSDEDGVSGEDSGAEPGDDLSAE